jgi:hypothetical protein
MKLMIFIAGLFIRRKKNTSLFSNALSEGIRDTFLEMGYKMDGKKCKI